MKKEFASVLAAALLVGGLTTLSACGPRTADMGVTPELFKMIPYIMSLILLAFTSKNNHAPAAEGIPYDKEKR